MTAPFDSRFEIGGRPVGEGAPVYIIAEAGVAHFGSLEKALRLVDLAAEAQADAVKFQIFQVNEMISGDSPEWRERMGSRCLPYEDFRAIRDHCDRRGLPFLATAHDPPSLEFLHTLDVPAYKIGSGEVENWPFFRQIARLGKPVIFSTGLYDPAQVVAALDVLTEEHCHRVGVLHCITRYPTPPEEVNLTAMDRLRHIGKGAVVGYSDHTAGFHFPLAAAARGAKILEKHISLDFNIPNAQDWKVSCGPHDLAEFIRQVREIEQGLIPREGRSAAEMGNRAWAGKSLVALRPIAVGEAVTEEMLTAKRPGVGIPPFRIGEVLGRRALRGIPADAVLHWEYFGESSDG
ncbi:MAG: N-acetylneuraminate synthase family protein [Magnetococcales bacterium]|nr:N-acetylneuraminate synthase family protein [Magnetococcales bacterium]